MIRKILKKLRRLIFGVEYHELCYAQEGEDIVLSRVFNPHVNNTGFYVDVGAHHPMRFSNTYFFYKLGWSGINLDAMPGSMTEFNRLRPRDINLEIPISSSAEELVYYRFNEPALNGFSRKLSETRENESNLYHVEEEITLKTSKLSEVLGKYMPKNIEIDFMTIDVEGLDFEVLQSNDWNRFRPKVVLVEILENSIEGFFDNMVYLFLKEHGYEFYAKTVNTVFFKRKDIDL